MGAVRSSIQLNDMISSPLMHITDALNMTVSAFEDMQYAANNSFDSSNFDAVRQKINDANIEMDEMIQNISNSRPEIEKASEGFAGWQKAIITANQAIGLIRNTLGKLGVMDMSGAFDRLDTMNRFKKTITVMTGDVNMAKAALNQLRDTTLGTAYGLDVASKSTQGFLTRGMSLGAATNQVRIWADAVSFYGEGTNQQLESVVDAIGKMYSKGKVEADQLDRLFDAGIGAAEIYANAVGKTVGSVKKDLSTGAISAGEFINTVSQALDSGISHGAAKDAGGTWATTFANMRAAITRGWTNIITNLDSALASRGLPSSMEMVTMFGKKIEEVLNSIGNAMGIVIEVAMNIYEVMSTVGSFIADNWSIISPIIWGIAAALVLYAGYLAFTNGLELISKGIKIASTIAAYAHAAATRSEVSATTKATAAQYGLNTALLSSPITWILIIIIAVIAAIYAVVAAINKVTGSTISATGIIAGSIAAAGAFIWNIIVGVVNAVIGIGVELWNLIATFANFFANVFNDPVGAIINLFSGMFDFILGIVQAAAKLIDTVLKTDMAGAVAGFRNTVAEKTAEIVGEQTVVMEKLNASDYQFDGLDYGDAWNAGYEFGEGIDETIKNLNPFGDLDIPDENNYNESLMPENVTSIANDTDKIKKTVDISQEDLKYMRDIAERDVINRFTTAEIKVDMKNDMKVSSDMDLDGVINYLGEGVNEAMERAAEGVHL
nr:tape measure protein [uncultured Anaerocolumna sp.]